MKTNTAIETILLAHCVGSPIGCSTMAITLYEMHFNIIVIYAAIALHGAATLWLDCPKMTQEYIHPVVRTRAAYLHLFLRYVVINLFAIPVAAFHLARHFQRKVNFL